MNENAGNPFDGRSVPAGQSVPDGHSVLDGHRANGTQDTYQAPGLTHASESGPLPGTDPRPGAGRTPGTVT